MVSAERRAKCREYQRRYGRTAKGKACIKRYRGTPKGQQSIQAGNRKRIAIGNRYLGRTTTTKHADAINAHIKEQLSEFKQRLAARAEAESVSPSGVQAQTSA